MQDEAFARHEFFDRRDRVQVKYEMLRRHRVDGRPVTDVAAAFGVSRQAFYTADAAFTAGGIPGLLPRPRGPQRAHKCTDEILDFVERWRAEHETRRGGRRRRRRSGSRFGVHDPSALADAGAGAAGKKTAPPGGRRREPSSRDPHDVLDQYEALRREATRDGARAGRAATGSRCS